MKIIYALLLTVIFTASCSKNDNGGPDNADLMINATAYIGDSKGRYDIAFYPVKRGDGVDNSISNDVLWIDEFFDTFKGKVAKGVEQYKDYLPRAEYYIIIRIANDPQGDMEGVFTTKRVDIRKSPSMENVMEFTRGSEGWFQEWKNKY